MKNTIAKVLGSSLLTVSLSAVFVSFLAANSFAEAQRPAPTAAAAVAKSVDIKVTDNGFEPDAIQVPAGTPIKLRITRTSDLTCATSIQIPSKKITRELPLNKTVEIDLGALSKGQLKFGCSMKMMIAGVLNVE